MKTDKELTAEIVIAVISAGLAKPDKDVRNAVHPLTSEDIPSLIVKVHETLVSLKDSASSK